MANCTYRQRQQFTLLSNVQQTFISDQKKRISRLVTTFHEHNQIFSTVTSELLRAHPLPAVTFGKEKLCHFT